MAVTLGQIGSAWSELTKAEKGMVAGALNSQQLKALKAGSARVLMGSMMLSAAELYELQTGG